MTADPQSTLPTGTLLDNRYEIIGHLGTGGFGIVYRVKDRQMGRIAAIKVLDIYEAAPNASAVQEIRRRFLQEASAAGQIQHASVLNIYDVGSTRVPSGAEHLIIVMEELRGLDMDRFLGQRGPMAPERLLPLFVDALRGLGEGHRKGIVHKDLKPSNVFLHLADTDDERLVIVDFGVARVLHDERLTQTGHLVGTPQYLAPEYIMTQEVTPAFDVYQMGLILTELLSGVPVVPYTKTFIDACRIQVSGVLPMPESLKGTPLGDVIDQATAHKLKNRFANALEFADALAEIDPTTVNVPPPIEATSPVTPVPTMVSPVTRPLSDEAVEDIILDAVRTTRRDSQVRDAHQWSPNTAETIRAELEKIRNYQPDQEEPPAAPDPTVTTRRPAPVIKSRSRDALLVVIAVLLAAILLVLVMLLLR